MEGTSVFLFIILSALIAVGALLLFRKRPDSPGDEAAVTYTEALNLLLAGDKEGALRKLRATVSKDSQNIDAYLKIGDILRETGKYERAVNVHKYLTVRTGLTQRQQQDILRSLAEDYRAAREHDKALKVVEKAIEQDRRESGWALEMRLALFEDLEDWPKAFQAYKDLTQKNGKAQNSRLALYKVHEGVNLMETNAKEARARFKDAIKIAPTSPPGYIYLADSYIKENRKTDALEVLKRFVEKVPSKSFLAFDRIKQLLYEGGVYGEIENLYLELIQSQPDNLMARLALAENYEKKGELTKAINACQEVLEKDSTNIGAKRHLVRLYHKAGNDDAALQIALELIETPKKTTDELRLDLAEFS